MSQIVEVSDDSFNSAVLNSSMPVLVEFGADWSAPCRQVLSALEELSLQYHGRFLIAKIDTDKNIGTSQRYSIKQLPVLIVFKNGQVCETVSGVRSKTQLEALLNKNL